MTGRPKSDSPNVLDDEIANAMAEAEAAVSAVRKDDDAEGDEAGASAEEVEALNARIEELEREVAASKDRWLRAMADNENAKKRARRETDEAIQRALQKILGDILPVADNLDRAIAAAPGDADDKLMEGIRMVQSVFDGALSKQGIINIDATGKPFDPAVHDALQQIDSPDHPPGVVVQVFERGYTREGKLFRPARVIVAGPGSTGEPIEPAEAESDESGEE